MFVVGSCLDHLLGGLKIRFFDTNFLKKEKNRSHWFRQQYNKIKIVNDLDRTDIWNDFFNYWNLLHAWPSTLYVFNSFRFASPSCHLKIFRLHPEHMLKFIFGPVETRICLWFIGCWLRFSITIVCLRVHMSSFFPCILFLLFYCLWKWQFLIEK